MRKRHRFRWVAKWIGALVCLAFGVAYALRIHPPWQVPLWIPSVVALVFTVLLMWMDRRTPYKPSPGRLLRPNLMRQRTMRRPSDGTRR